jgi:hypothetical protein
MLPVMGLPVEMGQPCDIKVPFELASLAIEIEVIHVGDEFTREELGHIMPQRL